MIEPHGGGLEPLTAATGPNKASNVWQEDSNPMPGPVPLSVAGRPRMAMALAALAVPPHPPPYDAHDVGTAGIRPLAEDYEKVCLIIIN